MNKKEFLNEMEKRLSMLEAQEREDMLSEYAQHIELKMESGMSEKEAIDDFGDIDSLTAEILEAYHIDPSYRAPCGAKTGKASGRRRAVSSTSQSSLFPASWNSRKRSRRSGWSRSRERTRTNRRAGRRKQMRKKKGKVLRCSDWQAEKYGIS